MFEFGKRLAVESEDGGQGYVEGGAGVETGGRCTEAEGGVEDGSGVGNGAEACDGGR